MTVRLWDYAAPEDALVRVGIWYWLPSPGIGYPALCT